MDYRATEIMSDLTENQRVINTLKDSNLRFKDGSILIELCYPTDPKSIQLVIDHLECSAVFDDRVQQIRVNAFKYRSLVLELKQRDIPFQDHVREYQILNTCLKKDLQPREHQSTALSEWTKEKGQGVVVLPTGAGKTILAVLAMAQVSRSTLIVVPTIDLMNQWFRVLEEFFDLKIGRLGGGERDISSVTVTTYDSAIRNIDHLGNRFGFLIIDECHHLPSPQYQMIARNSVAPFRLGLTATLERADGAESVIFDLLGDLTYRGHIHSMTSTVLSPYDVITMPVELSQEERISYDKNRSIYLNFIRSRRIRMSDPNGWKQFLFQTSTSEEGRQAFKAFRNQKKLAQAASAKLLAVWDLLVQHANDSAIIFTEDNEMAYRIAKEFYLAAITHRTKAKEREELLNLFRAGTLKILVTSKVLNEGVDVPSARVAIIVSGNSTVREHVQRLGRILRHSPGKRAVMYEIVTANTSEQDVNQRRRQHDAYERPHSI